MTTIKQELAAYTANLVARTGSDAAAVLFDGQISQADTIVNGALGKGQLAPLFELPDADGKLVTLESRLTNGSVVLTFYRGGWCPYCISRYKLSSHNCSKLSATAVVCSHLARLDPALIVEALRGDTHSIREGS